MEGYVINKSPMWRHAMKRAVGPGHKIQLDELFEQYGEKHDLEEGQPFVDWLRQIKLRDSAVWEVVYGDSTDDVVAEVAEVAEVVAKPSGKVVNDPNNVLTSPIIKKDMEVSDITSMSVRKARSDLKKITDIKLLKYAFTEVNQLANKDTLCRMLRKRISELEITRR